MTTHVPVYIPATALRTAYRDVLEARLGSECTFVVDEHHEGAWFNLRRCLERAVAESEAKGFSTFATVHEDVFPVENFQTHLQNAVACKPGEFFSGFANWPVSHQKQAHARGYHWTLSGKLTSQCFVWPVSFVPGFLAWLDSDVGKHYVHTEHNRWIGMRMNDKDDVRLLCYFNWLQGNSAYQSSKVKILVTVPCLVEHMGDESTCWNFDKEAFMTWEIKAQVFEPVLDRDVWNPAVYSRGGK